MSRRIPTITLAALMLAGVACQDESLTPAAPAPAEIRVAADSLAVPVGETATLAADVRDAQGQPIPGAPVRFTSNHPEIAVVDSLTGLITGMAPGTAEITIYSTPLATRVWVIVHTGRFAWVWGPAPGPYVAGNSVEYSLVIFEKASRVQGVPVAFSWPWPDGTDSVRTNERGIARVSHALPIHPATYTTFVYGIPQWSGTTPPFLVRMTAALPDGSEVRDSSLLDVQLGPPDHIELLASRRDRDRSYRSLYLDSDTWLWLTYRVLEGDEVVLRRFTTETVETYLTKDRNIDETLAAIVADRFGNATEVVPALAAADGAALPTEVQADVSSSTHTVCTGFCRVRMWSERRGSGAVAVTRLAAPFASVRLTLSAPGVPSRTVTVVGLDSIP
jgi:hypothetical protein